CAKHAAPGAARSTSAPQPTTRSGPHNSRARSHRARRSTSRPRNRLMDPTARARISDRGPLPYQLAPLASARISDRGLFPYQLTAGRADQALAVSDRGGLGPARGLQLAQDVGHVHAYGLRRDEQLTADLPVAAPGGEQREHLTLALGQCAQRTAVT